MAVAAAEAAAVDMVAVEIAAAEAAAVVDIIKIINHTHIIYINPFQFGKDFFCLHVNDASDIYLQKSKCNGRKN
jgi:hypothetical protein